MSYVFKFKHSDIFVNSIKSYPQAEFEIYQGVTYYNKKLPLSGAFSSNDLSYEPTEGCISLYEANIDRSAGTPFPAATTATMPDATDIRLPSFEAAVVNGVDPRSYYTETSPGFNPMSKPFVVKDGTRIGFRTVSVSAFNNNDVGTVMHSSYPLTASISREFFSASAPRRRPEETTPPSLGPTTTISDGMITHLYALPATLNYYKPLSVHYAVSSSARNLLASGSAGSEIARDDVRPGEGGKPLDVGLISIPSIFYGSSIKKGSVVLRTYVSGTLAGELQDKKRNGELIQVSGSDGDSNNYSGSVAGTVLYNEGLIILTGSWSLNSLITDEQYDGVSADPKWVYFGAGITRGGAPGGTAGATVSPSSSYYLGFKGTTVTPTVTMLAHARKNELNHSNNPTFVSRSGSLLVQTGSAGYRENDSLRIKNTTYSDYNDPTGSFKKTTYISQIGIYDAQQNLIGIAKLATPVKKTEERDFTFKLKLDM